MHNRDTHAASSLPTTSAVRLTRRSPFHTAIKLLLMGGGMVLFLLFV